MMFFVLVASLLVANALGNASPCPPGWSHYEPDNICIKKFNNKKCFLKARETCQMYGGDLVQIKNEAQKEFVLSLKNPYKNWIGLWDRHHDNHFTWVDGSEIGEFKQWLPREPNNFGGNENCAIMYGYSGVAGQWNDNPCSLHLPFICSIEPTCPKGWHYYAGDNVCIKVHNTPKPFCKARSCCQKAEGGDLAKITNDGLKDFIIKLGLPKSSWIDVQDFNHDGVFHHTDGSGLKGYHPWNKGEPNNWGGIEHCGMIYGNGYAEGKWNDENCKRPLPYVCSAPPTTKVSNCPENWVYYAPDNLCVKKFSKPETFKDARNICKASGGDLFQIKDENQKDFAVSLKLAFGNWIGVADCNHDQIFNYVDGSKLGDYQPWKKGEPNNFRGKEKCGMMFGYGGLAGKWNDQNCLRKFAYICAAKHK